jgi:DedD protein
LNDILKQRLVGALVIIALGIVFWPVVFVDAERQAMDRTSQVPPMPAMKHSRIETPQRLSTVEPVSAAAEITLHDAPPVTGNAETVAPEAVGPDAADAEAGTSGPALDETGIPVAWVLQVVSVSKREKAETLTQELIDAGYKAYNRPLKRGQDTLYRIYVGPVFDLDQLRKTKQQVDSRLQVDAIIARYIP